MHVCIRTWNPIDIVLHINERFQGVVVVGAALFVSAIVFPIQ